jgi:hypothetical protein
LKDLGVDGRITGKDNLKEMGWNVMYCINMVHDKSNGGPF